MEQSHAEGDARAGIVRLADLLERLHRHRGGAERDGDGEHDRFGPRDAGESGASRGDGGGQRDLHSAADQGDAPEVPEFAKGEFQTKREHQQDDAEFAEIPDHRIIRRDADKHQHAAVRNQDAAEEIADQQALAELHEDQRDEDCQYQDQRQHPEERGDAGGSGSEGDEISPRHSG